MFQTTRASPRVTDDPALLTCQRWAIGRANVGFARLAEIREAHAFAALLTLQERARNGMASRRYKAITIVIANALETLLNKAHDPIPEGCMGSDLISDLRSGLISESQTESESDAGWW